VSLIRKSNLKLQPVLFEEFLSFSTKKGQIFISIFLIGFLSIIVKALLHISPKALGDEIFYVLFTENISKNGIYQEMANGNPVGYTIIVNLISRIGFSILTSGRILSFISTLAVFIGLWNIGVKFFNFSKPYVIFAILTLIPGIVTSGKYIYVASDDMYYTAFFIWIAVFIWETANSWNNGWNFMLSGAVLSCTLLIRPLALLIFPATIVALAVTAYFIKRPAFKKYLFIFAYILGFCAVFLLQQTPALVEKGKIALENKTPDSVKTGVTWLQKSELTNILRDEGKKTEDGKSASWKQCNDYLTEHGPESLPKHFVQRFMWHPELYIKYCFIGTLKIIFILFRHTGILLIFPFILFFLVDFQELRKIIFFETFYIAYLSLYVIISLNLIETRHFIIPLIFMVFAGVLALQTMVTKKYKYSNLFGLAQLAILSIILLQDFNFYFFRTADWIF